MISDYSGLLRALLPEAALIAGALAVLGLDLTLFRRRDPASRLSAAAGVAALAVIAALAIVFRLGVQGDVFGGVLALDSLGTAARLGVLGLTLLVLGLATGAPAPRHPAEFIAIILFAAVGFTLMCAAQQLLLAFLALELASLSLYVLAGFDSDRPESAEAGLKYFLFGGMSAAFVLFGFSLLYGLTGSLSLPRIAEVLAHQGPSPLLAIALLMVLVGFGFKIAAAPFHWWAPDVYQGAPAPSAALVASASKLAGFVLFTRLLWSGLGPVASRHGGGGWLPMVAMLSGSSLLLGNLAALAQKDVRRLLAYSAIAHAGALLLGVMAAGASGPMPLFYYASTYGLAAAGAFGVIGVVERSGGCRRLGDLAGLHRRSPLLAACLAIFILSLAGVPPLAGFFGKAFVFAAALRLAGVSGPVGGLAIAAIFLSAVALYYYLLILKQALVASPQPDAPRIVVAPWAALALVSAAGLIVLVGLFPALLLGLR